jgi:hypothetical protein
MTSSRAGGRRNGQFHGGNGKFGHPIFSSARWDRHLHIDTFEHRPVRGRDGCFLNDPETEMTVQEEARQSCLERELAEVLHPRGGHAGLQDTVPRPRRVLSPRTNIARMWAGSLAGSSRRSSSSLASEPVYMRCRRLQPPQATRSPSSSITKYVPSARSIRSTVATWMIADAVWRASYVVGKIAAIEAFVSASITSASAGVAGRSASIVSVLLPQQHQSGGNGDRRSRAGMGSRLMSTRAGATAGLFSIDISIGRAGSFITCTSARPRPSASVSGKASNYDFPRISTKSRVRFWLSESVVFIAKQIVPLNAAYRVRSESISAERSASIPLNATIKWRS